MPNNTQAVARLLAKNWPAVLAATGFVQTYIKEHPGVSTWAQDQLQEVQKRILAAQQSGGAAQRIRGTLDAIKDVAQELVTRDADLYSADAEAWWKRADNIELGIPLAEAQARPQQKRTLARLSAEADRLLADVIDSMTRTRSSQPTD